MRRSGCVCGIKTVHTKEMKRFGLIAFLFVAFSGSASFAAQESLENHASDIQVLIEPVLGFQSISRNFPVSYNEGMITYGFRVAVGTSRLSGEAEFQYGSTNDTLPLPGVTTNTILVQGRIGPRTLLPLSEGFQLIFRGGLQIFRFSDDLSDATSTVWHTQSVSYEPYVGAGVNFYLFHSLPFSLEEIYVLDTSFETALGFRIFI